MSLKSYFVYLMAGARNGTLYFGVTSDLLGRVWQHKNDQADGFTERYGVKQLVWFEVHEDVNAAITREKQIKEWKRDWKTELIEKSNPYWNDLYNEIASA